MIEQKNIKINSKLYNFVNTEVLTGLNISSENFWNGFSDIVDIYYKKNNDPLDHRQNLQSKINEWHVDHRGKDCKDGKIKHMRLHYRVVKEHAVC